jgi:hypothetical protein
MRADLETFDQALDRRGFLRATAGGGIAIAVASVLPAGCARDYPQAGRDGAKLQALSVKEYAIARAAAEALLVGVPVKPEDIAVRLDRELASAGDPMRKDFKSVLRLVEHLTFLGGRTRRFTALSPTDRLAYLQGWSRSRFALRRGAYYAMKGFVSYLAYSDPATRALTRFEGAWPERVKIAAYPVDFGEIA